MLRVFVCGMIGAVFAILACSSSKSTPCNENPWECPSRQTCWFSTPTSFACLNSGPGQTGSACQDSVGIAACGDGLACLFGTCTPYCSTMDPIHACTGGASCTLVTISGSSGFIATVYACSANVEAINAGDQDI